MQQLETRNVNLFATDAAAEVRYTEGTAEQPHRFVGTIPYNSLSQDLGGFKERLMPTAFRSTLAGGADIRALLDHDSTKLLGRTSNGTLRVAHTDKGLNVEVDMPDTSYARDMKELVKRGDVKGLSFGFRVKENGQKFLKEGGQTVRELHDLDLREVSLVSQPAYPDTGRRLAVDRSRRDRCRKNLPTRVGKVAGCPPSNFGGRLNPLAFGAVAVPPSCLPFVARACCRPAFIHQTKDTRCGRRSKH